MTSSLDLWRSPYGGDPCWGWSEGVGCGAVAVATLVAGRPMLYTGHVEREEAEREACRAWTTGHRGRAAGRARERCAAASDAAADRPADTWRPKDPAAAGLCQSVPEACRGGIGYIRHGYLLGDVGVVGFEGSLAMAARVNSDVAAATVVPGTRIDLALPVSHRLESAKRLFGIPDVEPDALARRTGAVWDGGPGSPRPTAASHDSLPTSTDHWGNALDQMQTYHER